VESKKYFESRNYEPIEFLSWFLDHLHKGMGGTNRINSSPIQHCFQGLVQVRTWSKRKGQPEVPPSTGWDTQTRSLVEEGYESTPQVSVTPFMHLSLDLPPAPVFTSETERDIIPQVPLYHLLDKFNGQSIQVGLYCFRKRLSLTFCAVHCSLEPEEAIRHCITPSLPHSAHQALRSQSVLYGEEPHHRQLPHEGFGHC
jgi:U4/U6.U5 tri-snRNP-associated protein 2